MASSTKSRSKSSEVQSESSNGKSPPVHEIRYRNLAVAIWKNSADNGDVFYSITTKRGYQDENKQWHDSYSFPFSDLPTLAKAITDAHSWIAWTIKRNEKESK